MQFLCLLQAWVSLISIKAHIEQTSASIESVENNQIETEIARYESIITRAEDKIDTVQNQGKQNDTILTKLIENKRELILHMIEYNPSTRTTKNNTTRNRTKR